MKTFWLAGTVILAAAVLGFSSAPPPPQDAVTLESVLKKMDTMAATFRTAQAEFEWDNYQRAIDEIVDVQTGTTYYRRSGKDIEMMAEIRKSGPSATELKPEPKYVLFSDGKIKMYQPRVEELRVYDLGKNKSDLEGYVVLGFGGSGQDLQKTFDVTYGGPETVDGIATARLELVPKSEKVRNSYNKMILWIDLDRGVSVQQKFLTPQNDYRLCKYSGIRLNGKVGDDVFRLKTTGKTKIISAGG